MLCISCMYTKFVCIGCWLVVVELHAHLRMARGWLLLLTLGVHAQEGYGTCHVCVCVSVSLSIYYHSSVNIVRYYGPSKVYTYGLSSISKLWLFEKNFPFKSYGVKKPIH